jgi:hypothetical protein
MQTRQVRALQIAVSIAAISLGARTVHAQAAEAEAMFSEGVKAMDAGNFAEACAAFEASNNLDPRAGTLLRLAECREKTHQLASAWTAYKDALARAKDPRKHDAAAAKVAELEPKLSHVTIVVTDPRIDGLHITRDGKPVDAVTWGRALPVDGGTYKLVATAPGRVEWTTTLEVPAEGGNVEARVPTLAAIAVKLVPAPHVVAHDDTPSRPRFTPRRKLAIGAAAGGAATLLAGITLGVIGKGKHDDAFKLCPDPSMPCADAARATSLAGSAHRYAIAADVMFGLAAAGSIAAGVLWFTGNAESPTRIAVTPGGLAVMGRF